MLDKKSIDNSKRCKFSGFTRDIVSFGIIKNVDFIEKTVIYIELPKEDEGLQKNCSCSQ